MAQDHSCPASGEASVSAVLPMSLYRLAKRLPAALKKPLLVCYWPVKALWEDWQDYSAELVGAIPLHAFRLGWYRHVCKVRIGRGSSVHRRCRMYAPSRIVIGNHSVINYGVLLDGRRGLHIGDNVSISEGTVILTLQHDIDTQDFALQGGPVVIQDYVFVGAYARILPGVTIEEGAIVGAGSVVTHDVPQYTMVAGVPAHHIRNRPRNLSYQATYRKRFG